MYRQGGCPGIRMAMIFTVLNSFGRILESSLVILLFKVHSWSRTLGVYCQSQKHCHFLCLRTSRTSVVSVTVKGFDSSCCTWVSFFNAFSFFFTLHTYSLSASPLDIFKEGWAKLYTY